MKKKKVQKKVKKPKKNEKKTKFTKLKLNAIWISLVAVVVFTYLLFLPLPKSPKKFVENVTSETEKSFFFLQTTIRYPAKGNVTELKIENQTLSVGVSVETFQLHFGRVPQNLTVRKIITLRNNENVPVKVRLRAFGNISQLIRFSKDELLLQPKKEARIYVIFNATKIGWFVGEVDVYLKKPKYRFLVPLLKVI